MRSISVLLAFVLLGITGCTSVQVRPAAAEQAIRAVVIRDNPKVVVRDFVDVLVAGFARHGISAKVVPPETELKDQYVVTYVAYRNWDMAPYLCDATISIEKNGAIIATGEYHLRGKGGLSPAKWNGTKSKMDPVIDQMLQNFR